MRRRRRNHVSGIRNAAPIRRPRRRWAYSHQKIRLNASSVIPRLTCSYSGVAWYLRNASSHCAAETGGSVPTIGCHSVIDNPEWVSRVMPPTTTMARRSVQQRNNQMATGRAFLDVAVGEAFSESGGCCASSIAKRFSHTASMPTPAQLTGSDRILIKLTVPGRLAPFSRRRRPRAPHPYPNAAQKRWYMIPENELKATIATLTKPGKGILAADESTATITKRFTAVGIESTEETRRAYRTLMFTTTGANEFLAGVILFEETLGQAADDGTPLPKLLEKLGIVPGIKVDKGTVPLPGSDGDLITQGLDGLADRLTKYKAQG